MRIGGLDDPGEVYAIAEPRQLHVDEHDPQRTVGLQDVERLLRIDRLEDPEAAAAQVLSGCGADQDLVLDDEHRREQRRRPGFRTSRIEFVVVHAVPDTWALSGRRAARRELSRS